MKSFQISQGDSLELLAGLEDQTADAIITDPPYCSGGFSETAKRHAKGQGLRSETVRDVGWFVNDNMTTAGLIWLLRSTAIHASRILKPGGSLCVFTDWRMVSHLAPALESTGLRFQNLIVWDKESIGLGHGFRPMHEMILHLVKGTGVFYDKCTGNVLRCKRVPARERQHQTEKPVDLLERLIRVTTPAGGLVIDPYAGSGSVGVAAMRTGRRFRGMELDRRNYNVAERRLSQAYKAAA